MSIGMSIDEARGERAAIGIRDSLADRDDAATTMLQRRRHVVGEAIEVEVTLGDVDQVRSAIAASSQNSSSFWA